MREIISGKTVYSLHDVTKSIQRALSERDQSAFWVKAEMNKLNFYRQSGHCFPELLEKKEGKIIAQMRGFLRKDDFARTNSNFIRLLGEPLKDGIKILFLTTVSFDPVFGLSLEIFDIDASYTLGDLEREKQETISRLHDEGIFNRNKQLKLALLPQRIAIISVQSSKGYADFNRVIGENPWNYKFFQILFPSLLQGDKAVDDIINQLKKIEKVKEHFDVVAIIRGGGGDVGLSCYNHYRLAKEIALFPIPVLTGIGHATNETVAEIVSFSNAITPTKLAEFLIQKFHDFAFPVFEGEKKVIDRSRRILNDAQRNFQSELKLFRSVVDNNLLENRNEIRIAANSLLQYSRFIFKTESDNLQTAKMRLRQGLIASYTNAQRHLLRLATDVRKDVYAQLGRSGLIVSSFSGRISLHAKLKLKGSRLELSNIEKSIENMSPSNVLKRGYSITSINGKPVTNTNQVKSGDTISTILFEGEISSIVSSTSNTTES